MLHSIEIGIKIHKLRTSLNISQTLLAKLLGVSGQAVNKWEHGYSVPDLNNLVLLAEIFNVKIEELLDYRCVFEKSNKLNKKIIPSGKTPLVISNSNAMKIDAKINKNTVYFDQKIADIVLENTNFKKFVYSRCKFNNLQIKNCKCVEIIYTNNIYKNTVFERCLIDRCHSKSNIWSAKAYDTTFIYTIYLDDTLKDMVIKNCKLLFSSFTNVTFTNVSLINSSWHQTIFYNCLFTNCAFSHFDVKECHFKKCTLIDCKFDKKAYKSFNVKTNKIIRPTFIND